MQIEQHVGERATSFNAVVLVVLGLTKTELDEK